MKMRRKICLSILNILLAINLQLVLISDCTEPIHEYRLRIMGANVRLKNKSKTWRDSLQLFDRKKYFIAFFICLYVTWTPVFFGRTHEQVFLYFLIIDKLEFCHL